MEFIKPSVHFAKVYSNKTKDVTYLKTADIEGAQPKKFIYDKSLFREDYQNHLSQRQEIDYGRGRNRKLNYWPGSQTQREQIQDNNYQLPPELNDQFNTISNKQYYSSVDQPRNYQSPVPGDSKMVNYNYSSPSQSYDHKHLYAGPQNLQKMRNPMFADFDYEKYTSNPEASRPYNQVQDSLDQFKNQYYSQNGKIQNPNQPQSKAGNEMKESWLKFYGVGAPQTDKPSRKEYSMQLSGQNNLKQSASTDKLPRRSDGEADSHYIVNMHKFYGERPPSDHHFEKNKLAFYRGYTPEEDNKKKVHFGNQAQNKSSSNIFQPKEIVVLNPLSQAPFLRYQSQPKRLENVKVDTISNQWKLNQQAQKFFM